MPAELEPLTTERVPQKRVAPIAAAILAIATVIVLVAKPWGSDPVRPAAASLPPPPATRSAARPSSVAPTPRLLPTPDIAPLGPVGDYTIDFPSDVAMAHCEYGRPRRGMRHLTGVEVQPPVVFVDYSEADIRNIRSLGWSFELEMNRQDTVFNREWETVARSRRQTTAAVDDRATTFTPLNLAYDARRDDETAVFRVRVIVEWFTRNLESAGRFEFVLTNYLEGDNEYQGSGSALCAGAHPTPV